MAIVNPILNVKDSRWLQLEVCREFQRNKCTRPDNECKFAHPAANVEIQNGRVIACYDSIKGRCNREKPPCKYFHPPKHLKDQLIINGKNHLALKNALLQQVPFQTMLTGQLPMVGSVANLLNTYPRNLSPSTMVNTQPYPVAAYASALNGQSSLIASTPVAKAANPYLTNLPAIAAASSAAAAAYGAYSAPSPAAMLMTAEQLSSSYGLTSTSSTASSAGNSSTVSSKPRVETNSTVSSGTPIESHVIAEASSLNAVATAAAAAAAAGRKRTRESNDELLMQISGAYPLTKRTAVDKNGAPLYPAAGTNNTATYPTAQQLAMHQPFVPLSFYFPLVGQTNTVPRY